MRIFRPGITSVVARTALVAVGVGTLVALDVAAVSAESGPSARIFTVTESVRPGEVLGAQGSGFAAAPDVRLTRVTGTEGTVVPDQSLRVLAHSATVAHAVVPTTTALGLYAVTVDGSPLGWVNRARAVNYDHPTVTPGFTFRVFGRNLVLGTGGTPSVRFRAPGTTDVLAGVVDVSRSDAFQLTVQAPPQLQPGTSYEVLVSNGFGGPYGETVAPRLLPVVADAGDPFAIGAPWGGDFAAIAANTYDVKNDSRLAVRAAGDGVANDRAAIQGAIDAAAAAGGGTVLLPAGTYRVDSENADALTLRSNVVLRGAGRAVTTLSESGSGGTSVLGMPAAPTRIGIVDLTIANRAKPWVSYFLGDTANKASRLFVVRSSLTSQSPGVLHWASYYDHGLGAPPCARTDVVCNERLMVRDSELFSTDTAGGCCIGRSDQWRYASWIGNNVRYNWSRFMISDGRDLVFENNHITRTRATATVAGGQYGGPWFEQPSTSMVRGNLLDREGPAYPFNNDGESLGFEGYLHMGAAAKRAVESATTTTVTQTGGVFASWPTGCCVNMSLLIVTGAGSGQVRTVTASTPSTLTVDRPFDVVPQPGDRILVRDSSDDLSVVDNTITDVPNGIMFYDAPTRNLAVVGNTMRDAEGINIWEFERGTQAYPPGFKEDFSFNVAALIADNSVSRTTSSSPAFISLKLEDIADDPAKVYGTSSYLAQVRRNVVDAALPDLDAQAGRHGTKVEGIWVYSPDAYTADGPTPDGTTRIMSGAILDGNTVRDVTNAYTVGTGVYDTTIWNSTTANVTRLVRDDANATAAHGAIGTIGPDGRPIALPAAPRYSASSWQQRDLNGGAFAAPPLAFDGDPATSWWAQSWATPATPEWLQVDYPSTRDVDRVHVDSWWVGGNPDDYILNVDFTVAVAVGAGPWTTIHTVRGNTSRDVTVQLPAAVRADRLRVTFTMSTYKGAPYPTAVGELRVPAPTGPAVGAAAASGDAVEGSAVAVSAPVQAGPDATCSVDFGDGTSAGPAAVEAGACTTVHTYADGGSYDVTVEVVDRGRAAVSTAALVVSNAAPTVTDVQTVVRGRTAGVRAAFTDPGRADGPFTCTVDFGDGTPQAAGAVSGLDCVAPEHRYARRGSYAVTVAVTDKDGDTGRSVVAVAV